MMIHDHVAATPMPLINLLGLLLLGPLALAQPPARDQPRTPRVATGVIRGRVVRADTGEPLRRVQVRIDEWNAKDQSGPVSTMTDAQGRYELTQLPAGSYHLKAMRGGYVEVAYGQRRPFERGRPIELADGAILQNIDFALPPGGVVTGRVVDEMGEAFSHVSVSLARRRYADGERQLVAQFGSSTDDRGEFRIFGVPPGEYVVTAVGGMDFGARDRMRYVPTYYPGTPVATEARRVTVGPAQEVSGIVLPLARAATATVRGVVHSSGRASMGPFTVITAREIGGAQADGGQPGMATAASDGAFAIAGLLPGTYLIEAQSMPGSEFASREVVVEGTDVAGVSLTLSHGVTARGRIGFDTGKPPDGLRPSQVLVGHTLLDSHQMLSVETSGGPPVARDDWSFELRGLRGRGFIRASTLNEDWQLKRVRHEGVDITDTPLDFSSDVNDLEIEMTNRVTAVSGSVLDDRNVVLDATVIMFADDEGKWGPHSRFIDSARPDQQGRFMIRGLPPGKYLAIAVGYLEPGEERDPELLQKWRPLGTPFTLSEGEVRALDLRLSGS